MLYCYRFHHKQAAMESSQTSPSRNLDHTKNSTTTIIFEILSRLPAKSLIRFKSVSKLWLSIISSKDLKYSFLTQSKTRPRLLFTFKDLDSRKSFFFSASEHQNNEKRKKKRSADVARDKTGDLGFLAFSARMEPPAASPPLSEGVMEPEATLEVASQQESAGVGQSGADQNT